jgi:hypothetical protein
MRLIEYRTGIPYAELMLVEGSRPDRPRILYVFYWSYYADLGWFAPRWLARILRPLLIYRDNCAWVWARHCHELGLVADGERAPWPQLLSFGWSIPRKHLMRFVCV